MTVERPIFPPRDTSRRGLTVASAGALDDLKGVKQVEAAAAIVLTLWRDPPAPPTGLTQRDLMDAALSFLELSVQGFADDCRAALECRSAGQ